jgi:hypothetical protein
VAYPVWEPDQEMTAMQQTLVADLTQAPTAVDIERYSVGTATATPSARTYSCNLEAPLEAELDATCRVELVVQSTCWSVVFVGGVGNVGRRVCSEMGLGGDVPGAANGKEPSSNMTSRDK